MAPRGNLDPDQWGNNMATFDIHHAHIPTSLYKEIVWALQGKMREYIRKRLNPLNCLGVT